MTDEEGLSILEEVLVLLPKHSFVVNEENIEFFIADPEFEFLQRIAGDRALITSDDLGEENTNDARLAAMAERYFTVVKTVIADDLDLLGRNQEPLHFRIIPEPIGMEQFALEMLYAFCNLMGLGQDEAWPENVDDVETPVVLNTYARAIAIIGVPVDLIKSEHFYTFMSCSVRRKIVQRAMNVFFGYILRHFIPWIAAVLGTRLDEHASRRLYARIYHFRKYMDMMMCHFDGRLEFGFAADNLAKAELLRHRITRMAEEDSVRFHFFGKSGVVLQQVPRLGPNGERLGFFDYYRDFNIASSSAFQDDGDRFSDRALARASTLRKDGTTVEEWLNHGPLSFERCQRDGSFWYTHTKMESKEAPLQILRTMTDLRARPVRLTKQQWRNGTFDLALWKFWPYDGSPPPPEIADYSASALFPNEDFPIPDLINGAVTLQDMSFADHPALRTPAFDKVFADQGFLPGSPMYVWALCMLGRLSYPFNTPVVVERGPRGAASCVMKNDLTLMLYIYGKGGSGKSTIADAMRFVFSDGGVSSPVGQPTLTPRVVVSLSNATEEKFALAKAKDGMVVIAAEITDKFNLESTMLLKMLEGGTVEIMAKYETEHDFEWFQGILFCGNKNFLGKKNGNNDQGQLSRRVSLLEFVKGELDRDIADINPLQEVKTRERSAIALKTVLYFRALLKTLHDHNITDRDRRIAMALGQLPAPLGPLGVGIYEYLIQQDLKNQPWFQDLIDLFDAEDGPFEREPREDRFLSEREFNRRLRQERGGQVLFDQNGGLVGMPPAEDNNERVRDKYELQSERDHTEWKVSREALKRTMFSYFRRQGVKFQFTDVAGSFRHVQLFPYDKDGLPSGNRGAYYFGYRIRNGYTMME